MHREEFSVLACSWTVETAMVYSCDVAAAMTAMLNFAVDGLLHRACGHTYGKLNPWAVGSAALAAEGESNFETSEKRSPQVRSRNLLSHV